MIRKYYLSLFLALFLSITSCARPEQQSIIPTATNPIIETNTPTLIQETKTPLPTATITPAVINKIQLHKLALNENNINEIKRLAIFGDSKEYCLISSSLDTDISIRLEHGQIEYLLAINNYEANQIEFWNLETEEILQTIPIDDVDNVLFSPDQASLITLSSYDPQKISIWDIESGTERQTFELKPDYGYDERINISQDGLRIAFFLSRRFSERFRVSEFNIQTTRTSETFYDFPLYREQPSPRIYSPSRNLLSITYGIDDKLHLLDLTNQKDSILEFPFANITDAVMEEEILESVALSSDEKFLVGGTLGGNIYVWNFSTGKLLYKLYAHTSDISDGWIGGIKILQFSPESNLLLSVGYDGYTKLWNASTGVLLKEINTCHHFGGFTEDGRYLMTVGINGIELWGIP